MVVSAQLSLIGALFAMNCAGLLAGNAFQIASVASIQMKTPVAVVKPVSQPPIMISLSIGVQTFLSVDSYWLRLDLVNDDV